MSKVKTRCDVVVYEVDGEEIAGMSEKQERLHVETHWNMDCMVVLDLGGARITVAAVDLALAIQRCSR